jgi:RNA polymerase sigma-70 factor (ECF subfamily)
LLLRLKAKDRDAWHRLVRLYGPVLYSWCRHAGLNAADAEDVGQEVFGAVAAHIDRFRRDHPGDTFRGWLWTITQNKLRDHWRRGGGRPEAVGGSTAQQALLQIPQEQSGDSAECDLSLEAASVLHRALEMIRSEVQERTWQAFWRVTVEGRAVSDVAAELDLKPGAIYVAKSRVLRRLREELGDLLG